MGREGGDQSILGRSHDSQEIRREGGGESVTNRVLRG